jgi:putative ABC transport system permease protein
MVAALPRLAPLPLPPALRLALANCAAAPRRTALTVATVGIGLGCVLWLGLVAASFEASVVQVFAQSMRADLVVSSAHIGEGAIEAPIDDAIGDALRRVDGVAAVVGVRLASADFRGEQVVLDAFDPSYFLTPSFGEWPLLGARLPDAWRRVADGSAVVISSNFARHFAVGLGEALRFETPNGPLTVAVAGITTDFASPRGTVEMSRALFARYWHDARATRFFVHLTPGSRRAEVEPAIRQGLAGRGRAWRIISSGELVAYFGGQIRRAFASLYGLALIILAVILFGIADTLGAGVSERTREIGVLRVVGIRRARIGSIVVLEALVVGGLGLLLAATTALAMSALWIGAIIPGLLGWVIQLHVPFAFAAALGLGALAIAAVAALLPAQRAARLQPAAALRAD